MRKKLFNIFLSLCVVFSLLPMCAGASEVSFSDMPSKDCWSYDAMSAAIKNDLLRGFNGKLMPKDNLTRAQLAAILTRAFGAEETTDISGFSDIKESSWYHTDMSKAVRMGLFQKSSNGILRPDVPITREEAFTVLSRAIKITDYDTSALDVFTDKSNISSWAAPSLAALVKAGYINGNGGKLNPSNTITREEFAQVMHNIFSLYISVPGTYVNDITGNVLISSDNVTLSGLAVKGDLILGEGVGNGDITLDNVAVAGRLIVRAGGENSIHIINKSNVGSIIVGKTGDGGVRIRTEEGCHVEVVYVDDGLDDVVLEGSFNQVNVSTDAPVVLKNAKVTGLTVSGKDSDVKLQGATTVSVTKITEDAIGSKLEVEKGAKVTKVESAAKEVIISGSGTVTQAVISGDNTAVNTSGTKVTADEGTTGITQNGTEVEPGTSSGGSSGTPSGDSTSGDDSTYAASVTSLAELQAALSNTNVSSITIRGSITIPEATTVTLSKPVTIADLPDTMLIVSGRLINNSVFTSLGLGGKFGDTGIELEGTFINNGTFVNNSRFGMFKASFTNNGTVNNKDWLHCGATDITNNHTFSSIGDITLLNSNSWDESDNDPSTFTNSAGATLTAEGPGCIQVAYSCSFTNDGTVLNSGCFDNYGTLTNNGSFTYTDFMLNTGTITGDLTASGDDAKLENDKPVETLSELKGQLVSLDQGYDGIAIIGEIDLTEDLTISQYVLITPDGTLNVPDAYKLTISSVSHYNELKVSGKLKISGALETTRSGSGDSELVGQVTIVNGALIASGSYTITNNGAILLINGEISPEDITVDGNGIEYLKNIHEVITEDELQDALAAPDMDEITINADITLTENLDITKNITVTYDDVNSIPRKLTIPSNVTVTVKDGGSLSVLGSIINNGTLNDSSSGQGVFMGSTGSFTNNSTGILNVSNRFDIFEGTIENSGSISITAGDEHVILCMGAIVTNKEGAVFTNDGSLDMGTSAGIGEAVYSRGTAFANEGTFNNGSISTPSSSAYFGMMSGNFSNTGDFVNNGNMDINYTSFSHSEGTFTTYNSSGLVITGGSFSTDGAPSNSFSNEGYMRIIDQYGKDGNDNICTITLGTGVFDNDSNWLAYTAAVYSATGLSSAESAQQTKKTNLGGNENYLGLSVYNRLDFMADITMTGSTGLSAFSEYWVQSYTVWDGDAKQDVEVRVALTVAEGAALTVNRNCALNIGGSLVNNGEVVTAAALDDGEIHEDCGRIDIWPYATFSNSEGSSIQDNGEIYIRHEYSGSDDDIIKANVTNIGTVSARFIAIVHNEADLIAANSCLSPVYDRIEIKGDTIIHLTGTDTLTVNKNVFIEPGSGLIVDYGKTLEFTGEHSINNCGDISIYGQMSIGNSTWFFNNQKLEIGAVSGTEDASVAILSGGSFRNDGSVYIYLTGTLDTSAGNYQGYEPDVQDGTYT